MSALGLPSLPVLVLLPLMGAAAYIAAHHLGMWFVQRREPLHLWVVAWCVTTLAYLASRLLQATAASPEDAVIAGRLSWSCALLLAPVLIGVCYGLAGRRPSRWLAVSAGAFTAALLAMLWLTPLIVTGRPSLRGDAFGREHLAPAPGPLLPLLVLLLALSIVWCFGVIRGSMPLEPGARHAVQAGLAVYALFALNDMLHAARMIQSVPLFDGGFVGVGVGLTCLLVRRARRLHGRLEEEMAARTLALSRQRNELAQANAALDEALSSARTAGKAAMGRTDRLDALLQASRTMMHGLDLDASLQRIVEEASRIAGAPHVRVMLLDPDAGVLRVGAVTGCPLPSGFEVPVGSGYSGRVAATGRPVFVADVGAEPGGVMSPRDREQGIRTYWDTAHTPSPREIRLLQGFGQHAAVALERGRLHEAAEGRVRSLQALTHVAKLISSSLDRDDVLREIARAAARLMKAPLSLICVADEDRRALEVIAFSTPEAGADFPFRKLRFDEGILGWIATHREPVSVPDVFADGRFVAREWWRAQGLQSFYGMPIVLDGALLAVLALNGREPFHLAPEQRELLDSLVAQAAVAIRNALAYRAEGEARVAAEAALAHVKQLQGMLPICSYCKKIRNDRNYWVQIETYISERSEAAFSHSICPECHDTIVGPQLREWRRSQEPGGAPPPAR